MTDQLKNILDIDNIKNEEKSAKALEETSKENADEIKTQEDSTIKEGSVEESMEPDMDQDAAAEQASLLPVREILFAADFEPNTKQELNDMVSKLWSHKQRTNLLTYYLIGKIIKKGREKWTYGEKDMEKLAKSLETGSSNLYKACKFAEQYSDEQIRQLINGKFVMSWRNIAQNQMVLPDYLLEIYGEAENSGEFCNAVTKFKEEANSSDDGLGDNQSNGESQRGDDNTPEQNENEGTADEENLGDADSSSSEGDKAEEPIPEERQQGQESIEEDGQQETDENEPESAEDVEDSEDDDESPETESGESETQPIVQQETDDVQALTAKISEHEKSIIEKDQRIEELEMENAALKVRIQELEEQ